MKMFVPLAVALMIGGTPALADHESFKDGPPPAGAGPGPGIYGRIAAHYGPMGRDVRENFRDGPCKIEREWEKDGDYYERIKCRGPRD